jgi:hypothetical protein
MNIRPLGIVLVAIGVIMMLYTGFNYITTERVANIGPVKIDKEKSHPVTWSPIVGGVLLVAGIVALSKKKTA